MEAKQGESDDIGCSRQVQRAGGGEVSPNREAFCCHPEGGGQLQDRKTEE